MLDVFAVKGGAKKGSLLARLRTALPGPRLSHKNFTSLSIDSRVETESAKFSMAA
jgi:hypothetical protein